MTKSASLALVTATIWWSSPSFAEQEITIAAASNPATIITGTAFSSGGDQRPIIQDTGNRSLVLTTVCASDTADFQNSAGHVIATVDPTDGGPNCYNFAPGIATLPPGTVFCVSVAAAGASCMASGVLSSPVHVP
jgi:hypothetical protein